MPVQTTTVKETGHRGREQDVGVMASGFSAVMDRNDDVGRAGGRTDALGMRWGERL
jgi:hypothetical protein